MIHIPRYVGKEFIVPEPFSNYAVESFEDYMSQLLAVEGYVRHDLLDSFGGNPIYGFSIGDITKPMILIDGCIHKSHEWRTSYWIMHFMEAVAKPHLHYPTMMKKINELKSKYCFYFIPVVAPDTFVKSAQGIYSLGNDNGVDPALNFDYNFEGTSGGKGAFPFSEPESQNIKNIIEAYKPVFYINCHGFGGNYGTTLREPINMKYSLLYHEANKSMKLSARMENRAGIGPFNLDSSAYNWAAGKASRRGDEIISNVFEVGVYESAKVQSTIGVTGLLLHCIHADNYLTKQSLTMF